MRLIFHNDISDTMKEEIERTENKKMDKNKNLSKYDNHRDKYWTKQTDKFLQTKESKGKLLNG